MSARPIAASTVSFGLVSLPVKLYSTGESAAKIRFNWINRETGARVKQQYVDVGSGDLVPRENMIKGYEIAKNQYVTFEAEELKALEAQATDLIEIAEFVPAGEIDRTRVSRAYFLGPAKGGGRAYRLLSAALADAGVVAVARYSARGKQYLTAIRPVDDGLLLEQLLYADEVRSFDEVPREEGTVGEDELALARQLVANATTESFDPSRYRDEVRERVQDLIDRKIEGEEITLAPQERPETKIIDLMEALKASLDSQKPETDAAGGSDRGAEAKAGAGAQESAADATEEPVRKVANA